MVPLNQHWKVGGFLRMIVVAPHEDVICLSMLAKTHWDKTSPGSVIPSFYLGDLQFPQTLARSQMTTGLLLKASSCQQSWPQKGKQLSCVRQATNTLQLNRSALQLPWSTHTHQLPTKRKDQSGTTLPSLAPWRLFPSASKQASRQAGKQGKQGSISTCVYIHVHICMSTSNIYVSRKNVFLDYIERNHRIRQLRHTI